MLLQKNTGVSCCDVAAATSSNLSIIKRTGTCTASRKSTAPESISPCQLLRRTQFRALTNLWNNLTAGEKTSWLTLAGNTPFVNSCGEIYFLSAFNMFAKVNGVFVQQDIEDMRSTAPAAYTTPANPIIYSTLFKPVPWSAYDVLALEWNIPQDPFIQVFSKSGINIPASYQAKYYNLLSANAYDYQIFNGNPDPIALGMYVGLRHAYRAGYDKHLGLCGLGPTSTYGAAIDFIAPAREASFVVRSVQWDTGAYTEVAFESDAVQ